MTYWTYKELSEKFGIPIIFDNMGKWMQKIGQSVIAQCRNDYWLESDAVGDQAVQIAWQEKIDEIKAYCELIQPLVDARLNAADAAVAASITTQTKFNDTPDTVGDYTIDEHTSTISTSEQTGVLSSSEKANLAGLYGIMQDVATDIKRKFIIPEEFL